VSAADLRIGVQTITILALLYLGLQTTYPAYRSSDVYLKIRVPFQGPDGVDNVGFVSLLDSSRQPCGDAVIQ
jgi:hypothetical protein